MPSGFANSSVFLIGAILNAYVMIVLLRLILPFVQANFYNPLSQLVIKYTNPFVKPLRKIIPVFRKVDTAVLFLLFAVQVFKILLFISINHGGFGSVFGVFVWVVGDTLDQVINLYFYAIILRVVMSWVAMGGYIGVSPLQEILFLLTEPLLAPIRRLLPLIQGIDLSPLLVLLGLKALELLMVNPLIHMGVVLSL